MRAVILARVPARQAGTRLLARGVGAIGGDYLWSMALLQALLRFIAKSAGKILNAAFGWAVVALFGEVSKKEQTFLQALVAAAALWPVLLAGIVLPDIATIVLAFVPLPHHAPRWPLRIVWTALALAIPLTLGVVLARRHPPKVKPPFYLSLLRGFPITLGVSLAFLIVLITTPLQRIVWLAQGRKNEYAPMSAGGAEYHQTAVRIALALTEHGVAVKPADPPIWLRGPTLVMRHLCGSALHTYVPDQPEFWRDDTLFFVLYPNGVLFVGHEGEIARAHGVVVEALARSRVLQTFEPAAREVEKRLIAVLDALAQHDGLAKQLFRQVCRDLARIETSFDEWQLLYRRALQIGRLLDDQPLLLDRVATQAPRRALNARKLAQRGVLALLLGNALAALKHRRRAGPRAEAH
jgi:hypothetical protein